MFRIILSLCLSFACASTCCAADELLKLVRTIPLEHVEGRIDHMSISPDDRHLFVAALGNNSVEIVDTEGGSVAGEIEKIREPQGVWYMPDSKKLAVASGGDASLGLYDSALALVGSVRDLDDADNVRYDAKAKLLYVGYGSGALAIIDPAKAAKLAEIKLDGHPESFQLDTSDGRIFVNVPSVGEIEIANRENKTVTGKWPMKDAAANFPMALDETNHRLFVGCRRPAKLLILDTETGKTIASVDCCGDTDDVFFDAAANRVYVTGGEGRITVVGRTDADHYQVLGNLVTAPGARTSYFAKDNRLLFVAVPHRGSQRAEIRVYQPVAG